MSIVSPAVQGSEGGVSDFGWCSHSGDLLQFLGRRDQTVGGDDDLIARRRHLPAIRVRLKSLVPILEVVVRGLAVIVEALQLLILGVGKILVGIFGGHCGCWGATGRGGNVENQVD